MTGTARQTPPTPEEATRRGEIRQATLLVSAAAVTFAIADIIIGLTLDSRRAVVTGLVLVVFGIGMTAYRHYLMPRQSISSVAITVGSVFTTILVFISLLQPFIAMAAAMGLLITVAAALPYLEIRSLRRLIIATWVASALTGTAGFLPDDPALPRAVTEILRVWGLTLASGLVLFVLYRSSENLKASGREFQQLFGLSSDLAETTEPAVLGELVARHLTEATGFDDCVIYALAPETSRLVPFGSHPVERSLDADPELLADRPMLGRVIHDRARIVIDARDAEADPTEVGRLRAAGRRVMLLLPVVAQGDPIGVAELTARGNSSIDERRIALARTLAFEAAMAIENGRLYHEIRRQALHDPLTGLANRSLFYDRVDHALTRLERQQGAFVAVLFIDLDDFKGVNDTLGHAHGDRLLVLVAERLRTVARSADTVARLGGDEFALLLENLRSSDEALIVAKRAVSALAVPFELAGQPVTVSASIGVAVRSAADTTVDDLIQEADSAMYAAKRAGKGRALFLEGGPQTPLGAGLSPEDLVEPASPLSHLLDETVNVLSRTGAKPPARAAGPLTTSYARTTPRRPQTECHAAHHRVLPSGVSRVRVSSSAPVSTN